MHAAGFGWLTVTGGYRNCGEFSVQAIDLICRHQCLVVAPQDERSGGGVCNHPQFVRGLSPFQDALAHWRRFETRIAKRSVHVDHVLVEGVTGGDRAGRVRAAWPGTRQSRELGCDLRFRNNG
jgi:hypothetical protein